MESIAPWFLPLLLVSLYARFSTHLTSSTDPTSASQLPKRTIAGVSVVDTPIVRAAQALAYNYTSDSYLYNHVMRSWLFGALIVSHNETLQQNVDLEAHAIAALLHDLGIVPNSSFVTPDRRFEVDGAFAATFFIKSYNNGAYLRSWDAHRLQLVWDGIALHSEHQIAIWKEPSVATVTNGIFMEFFGPNLGVTEEEYTAVTDEFPTADLLPGFNQSIIWLCMNKPDGTYDTWQENFGEHFVPGYSDVGKRAFDLIAGQ